MRVILLGKWLLLSEGILKKQWEWWNLAAIVAELATAWDLYKLLTPLWG